MTESIDWDDYQKIEKTKDEFEIVTVVNKRPSDIGLFNFFEIFTESQGVEFTNKNVVVYNDTNLTEEVSEIKMKKIKAMYFNKDNSQILLKVKEPPHTIFYTPEVVDAAKAVLAARRGDYVPIYSLPVKNLREYADQTKLPPPDLIINTVRDGSSKTEKAYHHPTVLQKGIDSKYNEDEEEQVSTASHNSMIDNYDNSEMDGKQVESENARLDKAKSICMITTETLDSFKLLKVIGTGAFGKVFLAKNNEGEVFAMKRIRKDKVFKSNAVENVLLERKILAEVKHPLLLELRHVFSSNYRIYFF